MKLKFVQTACSIHPKWLVLAMIFGLMLIAPADATRAQNQPDDGRIYVPLFSSNGSDTNLPEIGQTEPEPSQANHGQGDDIGQTEPGDDIAEDHNHLHIGHIPEQGRFTANDGGDLSWPPQVKYIDDVEWDTTVTAASNRRATEAETLAALTMQDVEIKALLGERYTFINAAPIKEKWDDTILGYEVTYFSYSNNITIEAVVKNGAVDTVNTFTAAENQPPLRKNEVDAAIVIARQYWQEQGNTRVNELQGFTIQTFRTEGEGGFYDSRMTYVSFHIDEVSPPELLTWVDLTTETVVRAAIDEGGVQYEQ